MNTSLKDPSFSAPQLGLPSWAWTLIGMASSAFLVIVVHGVCKPSSSK